MPRCYLTIRSPPLPLLLLNALILLTIATFSFSHVLASTSSSSIHSLASSSSSTSSTSKKPCPYPCGDHGRCVEGACQCFGGYVGVGCDQLGCPSSCGHRGYCDMSTTPPSCLCFPGSQGLACELLVEEDDPTTTTTGATPGKSASTSSTKPSRPPLDRTLCNPSCHPKNGVCYAGECACAFGYSGRTCADRLCPQDCSAHGTCDRKTGECVCYAPYTGVSCAVASQPIIPRAVDTMQDIPGPHTVLDKDRVNRKAKNVKGAKKGFHFVEVESQVRRTTTMRSQRQEEQSNEEAAEAEGDDLISG